MARGFIEETSGYGSHMLIVEAPWLLQVDHTIQGFGIGGCWYMEMEVREKEDMDSNLSL